MHTKQSSGKPEFRNKQRPQKQRSEQPQRKPANRKKSTLKPELLIQEAVAPSVTKYQSRIQFADMPLHAQLKANIEQLGFLSPTEIQERSFEQLVNGEDLIGIANTGTGKTGAFLIPILQRLLENPTAKFQSLIVVPTRELALQVQEEFHKLAKGTKLQSACFIGGTNLEKDIRSAKNYTNVVIGTPGRLIDLWHRRSLKIADIEVLVLDEFDKMLDMGFVKDVRRIVDGMESRKQTLLFSATKDPKQLAIIGEMVPNPFVVEVNSGVESSKNVEQDIIRVQPGQDKFLLLQKLLEKAEFDKVLIFTETKHLANRLAQKLNKSGITADQIHGNKSQNYRVKALDKFKDGSVRVLVATDVAARGIDVNDVTLVVNYQVPQDFDSYIHRVGRTGRAGKSGTAYTFVD